MANEIDCIPYPEYLHLLTLPVIIGFVFVSFERFLEKAGIHALTEKAKPEMACCQGGIFLQSCCTTERTDAAKMA